MLNLSKSNEKGLIKNDNASTRDNLVIATTTSTNFLYSHNRKHYSIARKAASETKTKRTTLVHARKYNPLSLVNIVIKTRDNMYTYQVVISNVTLYSA